jgi:hypothetical protein
MVGAAGIEPATAGLEIRCSIRLSYAPSRNTGLILPAVEVITNPPWIKARSEPKELGKMDRWWAL